MSVSIKQAGFTAVELLITLFIAGVFLIAGYQLYIQVMRDGTEAEKMARVSNLAYDRMRKATTTATSPCSTVPEITETPSNSDIANLKFIITVKCANTTSTTLSLVSIKATYNDTSGPKELYHAIYVN